MLSGAAGFLGTAIARCSHPLAHLIGVDVAPTPQEWPGAWIQGPIEDLCGDPARFEGVDAIVHAAWTGFPGAAQECHSDLVKNVHATLALFRAAAQRSVPKFVFLSSGGTVYAPTDRLPIDELSPVRPVSIYGAGKVSAEAYLGVLARATGTSLTILRIGNPYGPGQLPWKGQGAIATAIACALTDVPFTIWGDGLSLRDYLYVDDVAKAVWAAITCLGREEIYNVGSGVGHSLVDIIHSVERSLHTKVCVRYTSPRSVDATNICLSVKRIATELGWQPITDLDKGIGRCVQWLTETRPTWEHLRPAEVS